MKRIVVITAALALILAFSAGSFGCAKKAEVGPRVMHNVARVYKTDLRESSFVIDAKPVEGSVKGVAYMDSAADGKTSLAWVNDTVYFVSEMGVDKLGESISCAEISFDGKKALFLDGTELKLYSLETRRSEPVESGISAITQLAISPSGSCFAYTCSHEGDAASNVTKLWKDGAFRELFTDMRATVIAVSDDGQTVYYFNNGEGKFCVDSPEGTREISDSCGAETNYNFTNDLSEAAFNTTDGKWRLFRLAEGSVAELDEGFEFTLKTDVYSMNMTSVFVYINDVKTFTEGLWLKRVKYEDVYAYSVALMDASGKLSWLFETASDYCAAPDGSRVLWLAGGQLYSTDMKGENTQLAADVSEFKLTDDGAKLYYISGGTLYLSARGTPKRVDAGVEDFETIGGVCVYVKDDGSLMRANGAASEKLLDNAAYIEKRAGQLIIYTDAETVNDTKLYKAYFTADGAELALMGERVKP